MDGIVFFAILRERTKHLRDMTYNEAYIRPLTELLSSEQAVLICDSLTGGDIEGFVNDGVEEW